jgi:hypothetical protein
MTPLPWCYSCDHKNNNDQTIGQVYPDSSQPDFTYDASTINGDHALCNSDYTVTNDQRGTNNCPAGHQDGYTYRMNHWVAWGDKDQGGHYPTTQQDEKQTDWAAAP